MEPRAPTPELQKQVFQRSLTSTNIYMLLASPHHGTIRKHKLGQQISVGKETEGLNSCFSSLWPQSLITKTSTSGRKRNSFSFQKVLCARIEGVRNKSMFTDSWGGWEVWYEVLGLSSMVCSGEKNWNLGVGKLPCLCSDNSFLNTDRVAFSSVLP